MSSRLTLAELEISRHDWTAMRCGCDEPAGHVAEYLREFIKDNDRWGLDTHIQPAGCSLAEPALPALGVLLAALAGELPDSVRHAVAGLVLGLVGDNGAAPDLFGPGLDPVERMRAKAREALWLFYAEVLTGTATGAHALEILEIIEEDQERLEHVRVAAADRLPWDLRTKREEYWDE